MANEDIPIECSVSEPALLQYVGEVVTTWIFVETVIEELIAGFLSTEVPLVYSITVEINVSNRIEALRAMSASSWQLLNLHILRHA